MRVRDEGYTKKLQTRYNKGVQAFCKAKGVKIWHKRHIVYPIQSGYVNTTLSLLLSKDEKSSIINIGVVWVKYFIDYAVIKESKPSRDISCRIMFICLVSIPPRISVSSFMGYLKGKSALMMFDKHANLKYKFGNRHFWAEGYYVSTVGFNEATIKKYIQV